MDASGESEQATAFLTRLEEYLPLPFGATVLGEAVVVVKIDLSGADELIAICRRRGKRQKVRLLDLETTMAEPTRRKKWSDVKARLEALDRKGLVSLLGDLYDANVANRRFLHSRMTPGSRAIEEYRRLVANAIYPDPFSKRRVSVRDAAAAIVEYRRSTGDALRDRRPHADVRRGGNGASRGSGLRR